MFTITGVETKTYNRGLLNSDMQVIHTATVTADNGDWLSVSKWHDDEQWGIDAHFKANGYPVFSNGTGARYCRVWAPADTVQDALNAALVSDDIRMSHAEHVKDM